MLTMEFSQCGSSISVFPHHVKSWGFPLWKPTEPSSCTFNYPPSLGRLFLNILSSAEVQALNDKLKKQQIKWEIFILRSNRKEGRWRGSWVWELLVALPLQNPLFSNHQIKQKAKDGQISLEIFKLLKFPFYFSGKPTLNYVYQYIRRVRLCWAQCELWYFSFSSSAFLIRACHVSVWNSNLFWCVWEKYTENVHSF